MQTGRSVVYAKNGGAAASQPLAVSAAISILKQGGSFIDAAIALSAVICVVEPGASHLGGDAFLVTHHAASKTNLAFNGSGEGPHTATPEAYKDGIPLHGYRSGTVPGLVSTWFETHSRYGKLPIATLLEQAIDYAENGFPANTGFVKRIAGHLAITPETKVFKDMGIDVHVEVGDVVVQKNLAQSLRDIAAGGREAFYEGRIAQQLIKGSEGWFSAEDLKSHTTRVLDPLSVKYRDLTVYGQPPPTQGMILMEELLLNERFDVASLSEVDRIHVGVESKKLSFADRNTILGDPEFIEVNVAQILSKENIDARLSQISMTTAANDIAPVSEGSDTTYFLVADKDGNAVSWIQSVFHGFGSSWVIPETGILLNNRLTGFSLDPNSPNIIAPGKRPAHTLNAFTVVNADGTLNIVGGTPGANIQVQTNLQLIVNLVDLKMNVQEAIEAPRWQHLKEAGQSSEEETGSGVLEIENRVSAEVLEGLRAKGHEVKAIAPWGHGSSVQLMQVSPNGTFTFGSDPRCEGQASGI
ncbi:MAG: gamma-glutamyltransferase family protein [Candidatus Planktophila sp.]|nr:gamma-glutamyltransferase family protein [Candidatus Planktophila sp.]